MREVASTAVFGYGSLVDRRSVSLTLGREVEEIWPARLPGWCRRFSQARRNAECEKTFARAEDGTIPRRILGLNIEPCEEEDAAPNGGLIAVTEQELERLDVREVRYDRVEVTERIEGAAGAPGFDRVITFVAKAEHHAVTPPPDSVILRSYAEAVEAAFESFGPGHAAEYRRTTLPYPVELIEGRLVRDAIPAGNPREW